MRRLAVSSLVLLGGCFASEPPIHALDGGVPMDDAGEPTDAGPDTGVDVGTDAGCTAFATSVVDHAFGTGQDHNQTTGFPSALFGPPVAHELDAVVSLGNGGFVVLAFGERTIVDRPGPDFIVFENPLPTFVELATVAVSDDGSTWHEFPCTAAQSGPDYGSCAGVGVVRSTPTNGISPFDPATAGGDAFDLASLGVTSARYLRITDRVDLDGTSGVFDLDAVAVIHASCD